ncbi:Hypothetical protein, putative [Bodo saltans]|uniref:Uncharacterized protein n=1 Tax=Bodo saltans TaxID=75058 RepID=A0A0S4IZC1_BODSA|nr:Hypothetical protein, putative [Bodo saltans]|eukprot:CUG29882.1 Hypothetical protein, putative [Bodo saltans]
MAQHASGVITATQMVSIDWNDASDVIAHSFTVTQLAAVHPKLLQELDHVAAAQKQTWVATLRSDNHDAAKAIVSGWIERGLLSGVRVEALFCRTCRREGHTKSKCPGIPVTNEAEAQQEDEEESNATSSSIGAASNCKQKFLKHMQSLERQRLIAEKLKHDKRSAPQNSSQQPQGNRPGGPPHQRQNPPRDVGASSAFGTDERRRGVVTRLEVDRGVGFLNVQECGEVRFFMDRTDYGLKEPAVGDLVTLKLDLGRDLPAAVEVRPDKVQLTARDINCFLEKCKSSTAPMKLIQTLLMHRHDWPFLVQTIAADAAATARLDAAVNALNALTAMVTFVGNREPVHLLVLKHFLHLMASPVQLVSADQQAVKREGVDETSSLFPALLVATLIEPHSGAVSVKLESGDEDDAREPAHLDSLVELATLVMMYRQLSETPETAIKTLSAPLEAALSRIRESSSSRVAQRKATLAIGKLSGSAAVIQSLRSAVFPTAAELSVPPRLPQSVFHPSNLPVNVTTRYRTSEELIAAQCKLLRADTFEASCRALAASCYEIPGNPRSEEEKKEAEHVRILHNVAFCGRVPTRDRDFSNVNGFIFKGESRPGHKHASLKWNFQTGACVCFTTGQDRTRIEDGEVFWGVVTSADELLASAGMLVVSPCEGSNFSALISNLARNQAAGPSGAQQSLMMEVPLFLAGYQGVVSALMSFVGPAGMPLPMPQLIVDEQAPPPTTQKSPAIGYIPPHARYAFDQLVEDVRKSYRLDPGQDEAMRKLSNQELLAIQGPPGTGKSFIVFFFYIPPHARYAFDQLVEDVRKSYRLDPGQDEAMRKLSNQELLAIQGPPGTGKSFIGARIVEVYIRFKQLIASGDILNTVDIDAMPSSKWEKLAPKMGPVVVITYKNHALDEFLIDLLKSGLWDEERHRIVQTSSGSTKTDVFPRGRRIVRVGGRSKEAQLADNNLNTLLAARTDRQVVNSFRERVYLMNTRLERLAKEIQLLEKGRVPKSYFDKWLTDEQRGSLRYEDRDSWLAGHNYTGKADPVDPLTYLNLLSSTISTSLASAATAAMTNAADALGESRKEQDDDDDDIQLSVFQEMRKESANEREYNNNLRNLYLSAEALALHDAAPVKPAAVPEGLMSLWSLSPATRHEFYAYLIRTSIAAKVKDWVRIMDTLQNTIVLRNHAIEELKLDLLQGADVIGFTTTGCAMNQSLLRSLRPSVLVVEEAAEVLEAQLLACMTDSLKQIVLIGDHYQLKPKVDTFLYEKFNHMNISMFERLAAHARPIRLVEQRRMHPSISALVRPFYDGQPIEDHESVETRRFVDASGQLHESSCIPGLGDTNLFLWEHEHPEEKAPHSLSKINRMELVMCVRLVEHLLAEGVHPRSVTVITPYLGQCRALRNAFRLRTSNQLRDVHVSTVDLFQGDENDIVILSMVRTTVLTEFLRMRNRMIVACSRARYAYIIVGNSKLLEQSPHWAQVLAMLRAKNAISQSIPLMFGGKKVLVKNSEWPGKKTLELLPPIPLEKKPDRRHSKPTSAAGLQRSDATAEDETSAQTAALVEAATADVVDVVADVE